MPTEVERLSVLIEANTKSYERAMLRLEQKTERAIRGSSRAVGRLDKQLGQMSTTARTLAGAFGAGFLTAGAAGFLSGIRDAVGSVAELGDAAERAGVSVEKLQVFRQALEDNGATARDADEGLRRLNRRLGEFANSGGGPAAVALKALNIQIRDSAGAIRATDDIFDEVIAKLGRVKDQAAVAGLAAQLFGDDAGPRLVAALRQGTVAMDDAEFRLRTMSALMEEDTVKAAQALDVQFKLLSQTIGVGFKTAAVLFADSATGIVSEMDKISAAAEDLFRNPSFRNFLRFTIGEGGADVFTAPSVAERIDAGSAQSGDPNLRAALIRKREGTIDVSAEILADKKDEEGRKKSAAAAQRQADNIAKVIDQLKAERDAIGETATERDVLLQLQRLNVDAMSAEGRQIADLIRQNDALQDSFDRAQERAQFFAETTASAISDLVRGGAKLEDVLLRVVDAIAQAALQAALLGTGPLAGGGGGGGILGSVFKSVLGAIPGFAQGGGGVVPGSGPPDSRLFVARVTPGERYSFTPPGRPAGSDGPVRVVIEAAPSDYFDLRVREISGDVAVRTSVAVVGEADRQRRRAQQTGARGA